MPDHATLTPQHTERIRIILIWTQHFRATAKKLGSRWWQFSRPTLDVLEAIRKKDTATLLRFFSEQYYDYFVLWATNYRDKKVVFISWQIPNFTEDLVILERYDPDYVNLPFLRFVGVSEVSSFQHFDVLFERFLSIKTDADYQAFNTYRNQYDPDEL